MHSSTNYFSRLLIILCLIIFGGRSVQAQKQVRLSALSVLSKEQDATPTVRRALEALEANTNLILPKGTYHFYPAQAVERYCFVSNHDDGMRRIAFDLKGKRDIIIDGQGSEFIFHGEIIPFNLEDASNIALKNFSIDWDRPFHSQGEVVDIDSINKTFDLKISDEYPYRIEGNELFWFGSHDQSPWDSQAWVQDIRTNLFFDKATKATAYHVKQHKLNPYYVYMPKHVQVEALSKGMVRVLDTIAVLPEVGWIWVSKGALRPDRTSPAIRLLDTKNVTIEYVNIYHAGGMGIIAERCENVSLHHVNVILPPDKPDRIVTTTADATHFVNCKGLITIDSCLFENMLDDATNIHGSYLKIVSMIDAHTIGVEAPHNEQSVNLWAEKGDTLRFLNNETMDAYAIHKVKDFKLINSYYAEITFEQNVSELKMDSGIENIKWAPDFIMKNCIVRNNRARSILLSSTRKMLIENNQFIHPMMAAISIAGDVNYWFESGNVSGLVIRNNYFEDGCLGGFDQAIITIEPIVLKPEMATKSFHKNIVIENNRFSTFDNPILDAYFINGLVFENNQVKRTNTFEPIFGDRPAINLRLCKDVHIAGNSFDGHDYHLLSDSSTTISEFKKNKGLILD